jgi:hypothetical protein
MLKRVRKDSSMTYVYRCPVTLRDDWHEAARERPSTEYDICPRKFAETCHFHQETVAEKILLYKQFGEGLSRSTSAVDGLQREIMKICDDERSSWTFTREASIRQTRDRDEDEEEDEDEDEEEESSKSIKSPRLL